MAKPDTTPASMTIERRQADVPHRRAVLPRRLLAEVIGTFALVFVAAGGETIAAITGQVDYVARTVAPGLLILAMIYAFGNVSGAHFNPVVTVAFALRRVFPWVEVPIYIAVQLVAAVVAALVLRGLFGDAVRAGMTEPRADATVALILEIVLTFFLVSVIVATASRYGELGSSAALPVGATIALCGLFAAPISGASMNPARSLGPAVASGTLSAAWLYIVGPLIGAALATLIVTAIQGKRSPEEEKAASGHE